ncbi:septum formation initiator family protein [Fictibacillus sp. Mic-4]|uniref:FtsB family cell division protein n=1 Tax=Fictibacillus TaxID=1329200 RepID=UPI000413E3D6|nr:septum formation initiator family protein [Fictibacillus gelatini]
MSQLNKKRNITELNSSYVKEHHLLKRKEAKRKRGLIRRLTLFAIVALVFAFVIISTISRQTAAIEEKEQQQKQLEGKLQHLKGKKAQLKDKVHKLNDPDYILEIARRDLFMTEKGETLFNIHGSSSD